MSPVLARTMELGGIEATFVRLFDAGTAGTLAAAGMVLASAAIGAVHALAPGHGKAIVAGYLVGQRGRARDAVAFGAVVAAMHTASVLVVGVALHLLGRSAARRGEVPPLVEVGPWLVTAAGLVVVAVGALLLRRVLARGRAGLHGEHGDHGRPAELPTDVPPLSRRGLVLLGVSGGLLPSPSAFLVLTTGLFTGRTAFALLCVAAFSVGLAATLTVVGLAVLWGRERVLAGLSAGGLAAAGRHLPILSAVLVTGAGAYLTVAGALGLR